jgi:hypothetical protein
MMVVLLVSLFVLWLGFAAISYSVARRIEPTASRRRAVAVTMVGAAMLVAPAWLSFCAVMWAQGTRGGRRLLARLGLYSDLHTGGRTEVLQLHDPGDCTARYAGTLCPG